MSVAKKPAVQPIHPGTILADELAELGMNPADLGRALHVPSNRIYQLLAGKRAMTADTALRLEQWLGVSAAFWLNLQKTYELDLAAAESGPEIKRTIFRRDLKAIGESLFDPDVPVFAGR
jgi:addiction module HigA family antidote